MKIYYWSPFISKVATVSSVIKSAESILKYSKKNSNINVAIVDAVGEWNNYKRLIDPKIEIINLNIISFSKQMPIAFLSLSGYHQWLMNFQILI